ncbi:tRNA pseudouridine(55) synthase TruB [Lactobacillus sp. YT155]|uniref:tRNA pseudouridine(55) synthase TruB n=1 Tax=Lactobacillus sp. YT155 TaxID=3060955 RepID=UPI00265FF583|nr:tRNA pseudouridine(55) synthase TruB [Lactobacillus sp. YT155]MDO1605502.1 tRNA pseudouridine(55) synthase TruB [Lactobacillus sp. YT155]
MNGIIPLNKDLGMTSADCVYKLRKILHERKIGHTGTLDPQVDGVLPICIGQATKLVNLLTNSGKEYHGEITLGFSTTTEDREGDIVERVKLEQTTDEQEIDKILEQFQGEIKQIPPMYSAVKVNGKKLYEYARAGIEVERPERIVTIKKFQRTSPVQFNAENNTVSFGFAVECSKGTYVRTLAVQVGELLGIPSHMSQLTRVKSAGITLDQTLTLDEITELQEQGKTDFLISIDEVLKDFPRVDLTDEQWKIVQNGGFLPLKNNQKQVVLAYNGKVKAIYELNQFNKYQPETMLLNNN